MVAVCRYRCFVFTPQTPVLSFLGFCSLVDMCCCACCVSSFGAGACFDPSSGCEGRIGRIIKLDQDVQSVSKEATALIGKAMVSKPVAEL